MRSRHVGRIIFAFGSLFASSGVAGQTPARLTLGPVSHATAPDYTRVVSVRELADGSLLVADRGEQRLFLARWDGSEAEAVSRVGGGPGEYRHVGALFALSHDSTLLRDPYSGRLLLLLGSRVVATISESNPVSGFLAGGAVGADQRGRIVGVARARFTRVDDSSPSGLTPLALVLVDRESAKMDTIGYLDGPRTSAAVSESRPGLARIFIGNPLSSRDQVAVGDDGWLVAARVSPYRVDWRRPDGTWLRGSPLPTQAQPVTEREKCFAMRRWSAADAPCDLTDVPDWPAVLPPFLSPDGTSSAHAVFVDAVGRAVIARTRSAQFPAQRLDLVDRRGLLVGFVEVPDRMRLVGFGPAAAYFAVADEDGLERIERRGWP